MKIPFFSKKKVRSTIFIPTIKGFEKVDVPNELSSVNGVAEYLGYHPDKIHSYFDLSKQKSAINLVVFEIFSKNVAFIFAKETKNLHKNQLKRYIKKFDFEREYDSYSVQNTLREGIENRSLDIDFLSKVLRIKDSDDTGVFYVESIGGYLYFNEGFLTDYQPADGLNVWAKDWKRINPAFVEAYEAYAKHYWGSNSRKIIDEINAQADAYSRLPGVWKNKFIDLHKTSVGTINFVMLLVRHHNDEIILSKFLEINHGRYEIISGTASTEKIQYRLGHFIYEFSTTGQLIDMF